MTDEQTTVHADDPKQTNEAWQEVGKQFQALGESLASVFRSAWHNEENHRRLQEMRTGLEAMVQEVGQVIKESANSAEAHVARVEAEKAAQAVRVAGEQTLQEIRPHLLSALRQVNLELQKLINNMETEQPVSEAHPTPPPPVVDSTLDQ